MGPFLLGIEEYISLNQCWWPVQWIGAKPQLSRIVSKEEHCSSHRLSPYLQGSKIRLCRVALSPQKK
jgi:hypothetical protein